MRDSYRGFCFAAAGAALALFISSSALAQEGESDGNRYFLERYYTADISSAKAFLDAVVKRGKWSDRADPLVIVDVRDATEYRTGHPEGALHSPYPRIYRECENNNRSEDGGSCSDGVIDDSTVVQEPEEFFLEVEERIPDKTTRVALLCRTGFRSVLAGNILANPEAFLGEDYAGRGYENVFNIWEGYVGQPKEGVGRLDGKLYVVGNDQTLVEITLDDGTSAKGFDAFDLDLNNNGGIDSGDKDGWIYFQGLPFDTRMLPRLISPSAVSYYNMP